MNAAPIIPASDILYGDFSSDGQAPKLGEAMELEKSFNHLQRPTLLALWQIQTGRRKPQTAKQGNYEGWSAQQISEVSALPTGAKNAAMILRGLRNRGLVCSAKSPKEMRHWLEADTVRLLDLIFE